MSAVAQSCIYELVTAEMDECGNPCVYERAKCPHCENVLIEGKPFPVVWDVLKDPEKRDALRDGLMPMFEDKHAVIVCNRCARYWHGGGSR